MLFQIGKILELVLNLVNYPVARQDKSNFLNTQ